MGFFMDKVILLSDLRQKLKQLNFDEFYPHIYSNVKNAEQWDLGLFFLTHGDEFGPLKSLYHFLEYDFPSINFYDKKILISFNNVDAFYQHKRSLNFDFNRSFGLDTSFICKFPEFERFKVISKLVTECQYSIDFHQTIEKTLTPFFIHSNNPNMIHFSSIINEDIPLILYDNYFTAQGQTFSSIALDEWALLNNKIATTLETGPLGLNHCTNEITLSTLKRTPTIFKLLEKNSLSKKRQKNVHYKIYQRIINNGSWVLAPNFYNFLELPLGMELAYNKETNETIKINHPGERVLFPKYNDTRATNLCLTIIPKESD